jgi:DNA-binding transcriptional LysR family regulator
MTSLRRHRSHYLLLHSLEELRRQFPKVRPSVFSATPNDIIAALMVNELKFGLFFTRINTPSIVYEKLRSIPMAVVCHPKWIEQEKNPDRQLARALKDAGFIGSIHGRGRAALRCARRAAVEKIDLT